MIDYNYSPSEQEATSHRLQHASFLRRKARRLLGLRSTGDKPNSQRRSEREMKKVVFAVLLVVALMLVLVTPIFAAPVPKPVVNLGRAWSAVEPGTKDDHVHASQEAARALGIPVGQYWKIVNAGLIPGHNK
jgi:hypothetical protein